MFWLLIVKIQYFLDLLSWGVISIFENKYKIAILYASYPPWKHYIREYDYKIIHDVKKQRNFKLMINTRTVAFYGE